MEQFSVEQIVAFVKTLPMQHEQYIEWESNNFDPESPPETILVGPEFTYDRCANLLEAVYTVIVKWGYADEEEFREASGFAIADLVGYYATTYGHDPTNTKRTYIDTVEIGLEKTWFE